jgi:hypothetical protein
MSEAKDKNESVVIALFPSQADADKAIDGLKQWDGANDEVKLGAVGSIAKENGKVKTHVGRKTGKGAGVGAAIGVVAAILSGGLTLIGGVLAGGLAGGAVGTFMKKSLHLTPAEIEALGPELDAGKVAVVVTCDEHEVGATQAWLTSAGGTVNAYSVPSAALAEAAEAGVGADVPTAAAPAAAPAAGAAAVAEPPAAASAEVAAAPTESVTPPAAAADAPAPESKPE